MHRPHYKCNQYNLAMVLAKAIPNLLGRCYIMIVAWTLNDLSDMCTLISRARGPHDLGIHARQDHPCMSMLQR